jgi:hypothetical protein
MPMAQSVFTRLIFCTLVILCSAFVLNAVPVPVLHGASSINAAEFNVTWGGKKEKMVRNLIIKLYFEVKC